MKKLLLTLVVGGLLAFTVAIPAGAMPPRDDTVRATDRIQVRQEAETRAAEKRESAEVRKAEIGQKVEERRAEIKKEVCERRQGRLATVIPRLSQGATSVKSSLDTVYNRVVGFYEKGQLTVENYDELVGAVETAKASSEGAVASIGEQSFTLDCDNPNVGQQLDGYRVATKSARTALMNYRDALVQLISAMRSAASLDKEAGSDAAASADENRTDDSEGGEGNE